MSDDFARHYAREVLRFCACVACGVALVVGFWLIDWARHRPAPKPAPRWTAPAGWWPVGSWQIDLKDETRAIVVFARREDE